MVSCAVKFLNSQQPRIDIVSADDTEGQLEVRLIEMRPHAVLVFEPTLHAVRTLEVYCALARQGPGPSLVKLESGTEAPRPRAGSHTAETFRVYLMVFEASVEKYRFQQCMVQDSSISSSTSHKFSCVMRTKRQQATSVNQT